MWISKKKTEVLIDALKWEMRREFSEEGDRSEKRILSNIETRLAGWTQAGYVFPSFLDIQRIITSEFKHVKEDKWVRKD